MNVQLDMTVGRPWALAFALALRDGLGVPAVDPPKTGFGVANPQHSDQADAWWSWWGSLLATSSSNRGLAELNDVRTVDDLASFGIPEFGDTASLVLEAAAW